MHNLGMASQEEGNIPVTAVERNESGENSDSVAETPWQKIGKQWKISGQTKGLCKRLMVSLSLLMHTLIF